MRDKTRVYLVRHGQTKWNVHQRMQGHQDSPLTSLGVLQAEALGRSLSNIPIHAVITSTSLRTRKTAEIIVKGRSIQIIESHLFKEIGLGLWEGRNKFEIEEEFSREYFLFSNDPENFSIEGGETFHDVAQRALQGFHHFLNLFEGKTILLVSHRVTIKLIMAFLEKRPLKNLWDPPSIEPGSICMVEMINNEPTMVSYGDTDNDWEVHGEK